jgi:hypothetical protein
MRRARRIVSSLAKSDAEYLIFLAEGGESISGESIRLTTELRRRTICSEVVGTHDLSPGQTPRSSAIAFLTVPFGKWAAA